MYLQLFINCIHHSISYPQSTLGGSCKVVAVVVVVVVAITLDFRVTRGIKYSWSINAKDKALFLQAELLALKNPSTNAV